MCKLEWVCVELQRIVNRVLVVRKLVWKSKSGRFGVRPMVALSSFRLAYNGLGIGEGTALKNVCSTFVQMYIRITNAEFCTSAVLLPIPCVCFA